MTVHDAQDDLPVAELVRLAKAGDRYAFGALYDLFAERVYRYALAYVREPADAEDLMQRVFLNVLEALPSYEDRGLPFVAWLFRIARNAAIDLGRARRPIDTLDAAVWHRDVALGPAQLVELGAEREAIRDALTTLTIEQRDVVMFRFFAGLSAAEIGALIGKREGAVRAIQFRALGALRRRLTERTIVGGEHERAPI